MLISSFNSLEINEIGLDYSSISKTVIKKSELIYKKRNFIKGKQEFLWPWISFLGVGTQFHQIS